MISFLCLKMSQNFSRIKAALNSQPTDLNFPHCVESSTVQVEPYGISAK